MGSCQPRACHRGPVPLGVRGARGPLGGGSSASKPTWPLHTGLQAQVCWWPCTATSGSSGSQGRPRHRGLGVATSHLTGSCVAAHSSPGLEAEEGTCSIGDHHQTGKELERERW